jgi:glucose-1-phosphate adenylyltransferase
MDYSLMLDYHITKGADCTIAVIDVPLAEASRFGIMNTDHNGQIVEFEEKPKVPKSTKASMGIYIFNKDKLFKYLTEDEEDPKSQKDFGKNVIPTMLAKGEKMFAYPFKGYWKDVGTIDSLWEANMDLIGNQPKFDIYDPFWKIHSRNMGINPQYIGSDALIQNSLIGGGCEISGTVINSVIGAKVRIAKGVVIRDSLVFAECSIEDNVRIDYSIIDEKVVISKNTVVGQPKAEGVKLALIGRGVRIGCNNTVPAGANIETNMEDYRGE